MTQAEEIARCIGALRGRAYMLLGNAQEAEDVLQDVFVRAFDALPGFRAGASMEPWLRRILENRCMDVLRLRRREERSALDEDAVPARIGESDPAAIVELDERVQSVLEAVGRLPKSYRDALLLHDFAGHDAHEIARARRLPYHTVRTHVRRARERVRAMLQDTAA